MKNASKFAATAIGAVMLTASMAPAAFAIQSDFDAYDISTSGTWGEAKDVTGEAKVTASGAEKRVDVMAVNLNWDDLTFTYDRSKSTKTWNPSTHKWVWTEDQGSWTDGDGSVAITNHSSVGITAALKSSESNHGWRVVQSGTAATVAKAERGDEATGVAQQGSLNLKATGVPTADGELTNNVVVSITPAIPV